MLKNLFGFFSSKEEVVTAYHDVTDEVAKEAFQQTAVAAKEAVGENSMEFATGIVKTIFDIMF